ncbi:hypothetical protein ACQKP3_12970 [Vibrio sp. DNB22_10_4]
MSTLFRNTRLISQLGSAIVFSMVLMASFNAKASITTDDPLSITPAQQLSTVNTQYHARWTLGKETLTERQRHTVFLELVSDTAITDVINVDAVSAKDLFFEQTTTFWQYTRPIENGKRVEKAALKLELFPAKPGEFTLPSINITLGRGDNIITIPTQPLAITVNALPEAAKGKIASPKVTANQTVSDVEITEGGAVTRSVSLNVTDLPGRYISELPFINQIEGVEIRTGNSQTTTQSFRADMTGTRSTDIHYRFVHKGQYTLPELSFQWWNTTTNAAEDITLPAITVMVNSAPPLPLDQRIELWTSNTKQWLDAQRKNLIVSVLLVIGLWRLRFRFSHLWKALKVQIQTAIHSSAVQRLTTIFWVAMGTNKRSRQALYHWLDHRGIHDLNHYPTLKNGVYTDKQGHWRLKRSMVVWVLTNEIRQEWRAKYRLKPINPA